MGSIFLHESALITEQQLTSQHTHKNTKVRLTLGIIMIQMFCDSYKQENSLYVL